jgi:predicted restriction endonuclease
VYSEQADYAYGINPYNNGRITVGKSDDSSGFYDAGAVFQHAPSLDTYLAIYSQILMAYGYRCALTGEQFEPISSGVHPSLRVVAIRPRDQGGPLHMGNYLSLCADAEQAFRLGQVIIADDFSLVADYAALDPDLAARLNPDGHLLLPKDPIYHPDRVQLAWHRNAVLRR